MSRLYSGLDLTLLNRHPATGREEVFLEVDEEQRPACRIRRIHHFSSITLGAGSDRLRVVTLPRYEIRAGAPYAGTATRTFATVPRVSDKAQYFVRVAGVEDVDSIGWLLHEFNREFNEPTPSPSALANRFRSLLGGGDTFVLFADDGSDGVAVLRYRMVIWSSGSEWSPYSRTAAFMNAAMGEARQRGAEAQCRSGEGRGRTS